MRKGIKFVAFLSYADPDRSLVQCLAELFQKLGERVFFATKNLSESGSPKWREEIAAAVRDSACLVHISTRHSLRRPWVLYESGIADAYGVTRVCARVSNVVIRGMIELPGPEAYVYNLFETEHLKNLVVKVIHVAQGGDRDKVEHRVAQAFGEIRAVKNTVKRICCLARTRWAFIAGNLPRGARRDMGGALKAFVRELANALLNSGLNIVSCPQVKPVGLVAARLAVDWGLRPDCDRETYRLGGIYPVDRMARTQDVSDEARKKWLEHLMTFRRSYLEDVEWLIVVGGNEGTFEEYEAASNLGGIRVVAIPCFGGAAAKIAQKNRRSVAPNCRDCKGRRGSCTAVSEIVTFMTRGGP
jgi:hypothetical protein